MELDKMTNDEKSLLLFFECRAVDNGGLVDTRYMNDEDREIAKDWVEKNFVQYGRITARDAKRLSYTQCTHAVFLSEEAWKLAHQERRNRQRRLHRNISWITTKENMEIHGHSHFSGMNNGI